MQSGDEHEDHEVMHLSCVDYQLTDASMSHGANGPVFRCRYGPLSTEASSAISRAIAARRFVRFVFPESSVLLSNVKLDSNDDAWVRIEGRVIETRRFAAAATDYSESEL